MAKILAWGNYCIQKKDQKKKLNRNTNAKIYYNTLQIFHCLRKSQVKSRTTWINFDFLGFQGPQWALGHGPSGPRHCDSL